MEQHGASVLALVLITLSPSLPSTALDHGVAELANPDFEQGEIGHEPPGWQMRPLSRPYGYTMRISDLRPFSGGRCLEIALPETPAGGLGFYGRVTQTIPAAAFRGRRVRFHAALRAAELGPTGRSHAALYARVLRPAFRPGHWRDMVERGIRTADWQAGSVIVDVAGDAEALEVGFILHELGTAAFDAAGLEVVGKEGHGNEPARPLTALGLDNLIAFTRLLGYVRYFHPSDEAAAVDWEALAIEAIPIAENARTPAELARRLGGLFLPFAPTVQVYPTGTAPVPSPLPSGATRVLAWQHRGVGSNYMKGAFESERVTEPSPKPPFASDLPGGVSCRVPLALPSDDPGTLPRATRRPRPLAKPAHFPPTGDDRDTRLAGVALGWNIIQHFYPYFDEVKTDWHAVLRQSLTSAATDQDASAFHDTLRRMNAAIQDGHGVVRGGSGCAIQDGALPIAWDWFEDRLVVVNRDPPHADRIRPGDVVITIDGRPSAERMAAAERLVSGATPQFRRYRAMQDLRNGPAGQPVTLELRSPGGTAYAVTLTRQPADDSPLRGPGLREWRLERLVEIEPGVLYVDPERFDGRTFAEEVIPRLASARAAIFEVRGHPVGMPYTFVTQLIDKPLVMRRFCPDAIIRVPDREEVVDCAAEPMSMPPATEGRLRLKVAFLTDGRAVSWGETFLSMAETSGVGPIVGAPTSGTNGGVNIYILPGGYRFSFTQQRVRKEDGSPHHGVGILPTVVVRRTIKAVAEGRDEVLEKALQLLEP